MKVVVAIDSLKNSLTSVEAGRAIEAGVQPMAAILSRSSSNPWPMVAKEPSKPSSTD
ncbi:hypothetical protein [Megasphaera sp.]|uniref:hypothetical protein n=1 Tax=Megasphaera sp. TaxID=2023260 RepID=UPI003FEF464F